MRLWLTIGWTLAFAGSAGLLVWSWLMLRKAETLTAKFEPLTIEMVSQIVAGIRGVTETRVGYRFDQWTCSFSVAAQQIRVTAPSLERLLVASVDAAAEAVR